MKNSPTIAPAQPLWWWTILGFVGAAFLAVPLGIVGYAAGGAIIGGAALLGTLLLIQLPIMLFALRGIPFTLGKPPDDVP